MQTRGIELLQTWAPKEDSSVLIRSADDHSIHLTKVL
jgi:hypothetical protein